MKVLVTGGAGYIGSVSTAQLLQAGHDVVVFDSLELGHRAAVDPRAELIVGDLRDEAAIASALIETRPDAVMHFAAYALVGESMNYPERYFRNNLVGGINLVEGMLKADVSRIVFSSTCATYGQPESVPISEAEDQSPTNPYGESKLALESVLAWHHRCHGTNAILLRYFNACGATEDLGEDHDPETHIIPLLLQTAQGRREGFKIFGTDYDTPDGTCIRDYVHIVDLAQAHILALGHDGCEAFNLGNGQGYSVQEVIDCAERITGKSIEAETAQRRPGDPPRLVAEANKAWDILGWKPEFSTLESIVDSAWAWHEKNPDGYDD